MSLRTKPSPQAACRKILGYARGHVYRFLLLILCLLNNFNFKIKQMLIIIICWFVKWTLCKYNNLFVVFLNFFKLFNEI